VLFGLPDFLSPRCENPDFAGRSRSLLSGSRWMVAELNKIRDIVGRVAATHGVEVVEVEMRGEVKPAL